MLILATAKLTHSTFNPGVRDVEWTSTLDSGHARISLYSTKDSCTGGHAHACTGVSRCELNLGWTHT